MQRTLILIGAIAAILIHVSCGSGNSSGSPTGPSQPQPFTQTVAATVGVFGTNFHPLTIPRAGTMTATLTWPGSADLDLYLTNSTCTDLFAGNCQMLGTANGLVNPEIITRTVASGEVFKMWVDNQSRVSSANYSIALLIQ